MLLIWNCKYRLICLIHSCHLGWKLVMATPRRWWWWLATECLQSLRNYEHYVSVIVSVLNVIVRYYYYPHFTVQKLRLRVSEWVSGSSWNLSRSIIQWWVPHGSSSRVFSSWKACRRHRVVPHTDLHQFWLFGCRVTSLLSGSHLIVPGAGSQQTTLLRFPGELSSLSSLSERGQRPVYKETELLAVLCSSWWLCLDRQPFNSSHQTLQTLFTSSWTTRSKNHHHW